MEIKLFSVYDSKALNYAGPFAAASRGVAVRMLMTAVADASTDVSKFPGDFTLFELGSLDTSSGVLKGCVNGPELVLRADQAKEDTSGNR